MRAIVVDDSNKASASSLSIGQAEKPAIKDPKHAVVAVKAFVEQIPVVNVSKSVC